MGGDGFEFPSDAGQGQQLTQEQILQNQQNVRIQAELDQREDLQRDQKKTVEGINAVLAQMADLQGDINTVIQKDQEKLDRAQDNLERAGENMGTAKGEMDKKRAKMMKNFKNFAACFIVLVVIMSVLLWQMFGK